MNYRRFKICWTWWVGCIYSGGSEGLAARSPNSNIGKYELELKIYQTLIDKVLMERFNDDCDIFCERKYNSLCAINLTLNGYG